MRRDRDDWRDGPRIESTTAATYRTEFSSDEPVSLAVIRAVSAVTGIEPTVLTPLSDCIETDALEALFSSPDGPMTAQSLNFQYAGCDVTVHGDGSIALMAPAFD